MSTNLLLLPAFLAAVAACGSAACQPSWPPDPEVADPDRAAAHLALEPDAPWDAAPNVVRVRALPDADAIADPDRLYFVAGHVGPAHLRQVEDDDLSMALSERILPAVRWTDVDGSALIAVARILSPDETYGVISGDPPLFATIDVADTSDLATLPRTWPPPRADDDEGSTDPSIDPATAPTFAIWCDEFPLDLPAGDVPFSPADVSVTWSIEPLAGAGCLRADRAPDPADILAIAPPVAQLPGGRSVRLDPSPLGVRVPSAPAPIACVSPAIPFGPGCVDVADDRATVVGPGGPILWSLAINGAPPLRWTTAPNGAFTISALVPNSDPKWSLAAIDETGAASAFEGAWHTALPMPHVILSEVFANPVGPEPAQEWVEIFNDGSVPAALAGFVLHDLGGETPLPSAILAPGAFGILVNEGFDPSGEYDPAPAPGALLLVVPKLGKSGLKNDGEPLKLVDASGAIVSRFPALPKPKPGASVARVGPTAPDNAAASFVVGAPTPGAWPDPT